MGQTELPELITGMIGGQPFVPGGGRGIGGGGGGWDSPLTPGSGSEGWGSPPAGMGANPWGRTFAGNLQPGGARGKGRSVAAKLNEGERHKNGDYRVSFEGAVVSILGFALLNRINGVSDPEPGARDARTRGRLHLVEFVQRRDGLHKRKHLAEFSATLSS